MDFLYFLLLGALAGWLAGKLTKGSGFGFIANMIIGVIGAILGGFLFSLLGLESNGFIGSLVTAVVGALVLLFIASKIKK